MSAVGMYPCTANMVFRTQSCRRLAPALRKWVSFWENDFLATQMISFPIDVLFTTRTSIAI